MPTSRKLVVATAVASLLAPLCLAPASSQPLRRHAAAHAHRAYAAHRTRHHAYRRPAHGSYAYRGGPYAYAYGPYGPYGPTSADPYPPTEADNPYNPYAPPGAAIRAAARRNQYAPGVTNELAPDNIATATGGPSGGIPGMSGR